MFGTIANVLTFYIIFPVSGLFELTPRTLFYPTVFFFVGLFFFSIKIVGAGDSKYLVSLFLLVPLGFQKLL